MVRNQQQFGWRAEAVIRVGKQARVYMPMRAHQRQTGHLAIQRQRHRPLRRVWREISCFW